MALGRLLSAESKTASLGMPPSGDQNTIVIPAFGGAKPNQDGALYPDASYVTSAANGYGRNELVYACIRKLAENLPQSFLRVYPLEHGEALDGHRLRRLFAAPNPVTTEFEFFELSVTYLNIAGNCYWLIVRGRDGLPAELWPLRPDCIRIFPTVNPRVWNYGYVLDPSSGARSIGQDIIPIPAGDVVHVKFPNPLDQYFGQPPMRPAARAVSLDNAATDFVDRTLRSDATPSSVITVTEAVDAAVAERIRARWMARFSGANRGGPAVLQKGMDVKILGQSLKDLEFPDLRAESESRICAVFGVPAVLVGAKVGLDRSTFTNYEQAHRELWEGAINSLQWHFLDAVQARLLPDFAGVGRQRVTLRWDNSEVAALREAESAKWERATNGLARGGITLNDYRKIVGLVPVPNGDVFLIPAGVTLQPAEGELIQPAEVPQLQAASYADRFLAEHKELAGSNGHG
jgi:HK97 family phage portal protein